MQKMILYKLQYSLKVCEPWHLWLITFMSTHFNTMLTNFCDWF